MMVMSNNDLQSTFNAWVVYQGIYAHFTREYDYFKYNGKGNWNNIDSMQRSFAKQEKVCGQLTGIKGQYLIFEDNVINIRKHIDHKIACEY